MIANAALRLPKLGSFLAAIASVVVYAARMMLGIGG